MYSPIDIEGVEYQLKPMNCPFHITIYKSNLRSYRELPLRYAELGTVYRYERSGVLHGLLRVRGFTQDDAHIFCRLDQLEDEIMRVLDFVTDILEAFGFERLRHLPARPSRRRPAARTSSGRSRPPRCAAALEKRGLPYEVDPGEGTFYGPKIDIKIKDALDRSWQCSTIQVDFNNPNRFDLKYIGEDGKAHRPVMVHRALLGSLERFFGVLIEHYAGAFPVWLAPVQAVLVPVAERHQEYARAVADELRAQGLRVHVDDRNEKLGYRIREAQVQKVPYMLVVGDKEVEGRTVSVRHRHAGDLGASDVAAFASRVCRLAAERAVREEVPPPKPGGVS